MEFAGFPTNVHRNRFESNLWIKGPPRGCIVGLCCKQAFGKLNLVDKVLSDQNSSRAVWRFLFAARPADEELTYRNFYLADDIKQLRGISFVSIGFILALTLKDLLDLKTNPELLNGILIRTVVILVGVFTIWILTKPLSPRQVDFTAGIFAASVALGLLSIHLLPGISTARMISIGTLFIMTVHIAIPTYATTLAIPIMIFIFGDWFILYLPGREHLSDFRILAPIIYLFAQYIAVLASAYHHRVRFQAFANLEQQIRLNFKLQLARSQIKLLSGMLPICANCKKIRDDQGYYRQIEEYITEHSEAVFTHGICPQCIKELYPELSVN